MSARDDDKAKRRIIIYAPTVEEKADFVAAAKDSRFKGNLSGYGWWLFKKERAATRAKKDMAQS